MKIPKRYIILITKEKNVMISYYPIKYLGLVCMVRTSNLGKAKKENIKLDKCKDKLLIPSSVAGLMRILDKYKCFLLKALTFFIVKLKNPSDTF